MGAAMNLMELGKLSPEYTEYSPHLPGNQLDRWRLTDMLVQQLGSVPIF